MKQSVLSKVYNEKVFQVVGEKLLKEVTAHLKNITHARTLYKTFKFFTIY